MAIFTATVIFGLNTPITKSVFADGTITPLGMMTLRLIGAGILFWVASIFVPRRKVVPADYLLMFSASFFGLTFNQMPFFMGLGLTSPIDASVITTTVPILTMLLAAVFLREPITARKVIGVLLGAAGVLWLIMDGRNGSGGSSLRGDLLCLTGSVSYATYLTLFKRLIRRHHPVTLMKWMFLFSTLCTMPFLYNDFTAIQWETFSGEKFLQLGFIVTLATFVAYMLIPVAQRFLRPTVVSSYNYLQPLISSAIAIIIGMGALSWVKGMAALMIFAGVYVITISKSREDLEREAEARAKGK